MKIPIENIYYLLCYAWNKLEERDLVRVNPEDYRHLADLFARVLINGCEHLIKKGLDRNYVEIGQNYPGLKGKIDFSESLKRNLFHKAQSYCVYDEIEHNVLHNQIMKSTLHLLSRVQDLESINRRSIYTILPSFGDVDELALEQKHFSQTQIHRHNYFYDFLLRICQIVFSQLTIGESKGVLSFKEFDDRSQSMGDMFEAFVRNFYKLEQSHYSVKKEYIHWAGLADQTKTVRYSVQNRR